MNKPILKTKAAYDYIECRDYLQDKYGYNERDWAGKYKKDRVERDKMDESLPDLDFWHWVCENYQIHNGCYITFTEDELAEIQEEWVKTIYGYYLKEFAHGTGEVTFYCWW